MSILGAQSVLVTGATGYVGSRLVQRLVAAGHDVYAVVRPDSALARLGESAPRVTLQEHDGTTDSMLRIVAESRPGMVFHLASLFLAQHGPQDVTPLVTSNVLLGAQLAEAMVAAGVHRLVNTGTAWQHYRQVGYDPVCLYAATKEAFEALLAYYVDATPLRSITLKLYDTFGPGDWRRKLPFLLREAALHGSALGMSPGEQRLDLVYIDDVVDAFLVAARRLEAEQVHGHEQYAVRSGTALSLRELVGRFEAVWGQPLPIRFGERPYRPREVMDPWTGGQTLPGWQPAVPLEEGIRRFLADVSAPGS